MTTRKWVAAATCALAFTAYYGAPAIAADLQNGSSQSCDGTGTWHFVNNQTGGAGAGTLEAAFSVDGSTLSYAVGASKVNRSNQHFYVQTEGDAVLLDASTNLPGRLVLSDFSCDGGGGGGKDPDPKK